MHKYYQCIHKKEVVVKKSSSGGAFTAISDYILKNRGVIYGVILNKDLKAQHIRAEDTRMRDYMRGSKYIASKISREIYGNICDDLRRGQIVLFTGTPCQIASLKKVLKVRNISDELLYSVEIICHGVGSERFFDDYIQHLEKHYKGKAISCKFRAKYREGQKQDMEVIFNNRKVYNASSTKYDWFYSVYLKNLILRPACYTCKFATENRNADISLSDLWGKDYERKTYSLVIVNNDKGEKLFKMASKDMEYVEKKEDEIYVPYMHAPVKKPDERDAFWMLYNEEGYMKVQKEIGNNTILGKSKAFAVLLAWKLHIAWLIKIIQRRFYVY